VVGETDDSFLNDMRVQRITPKDARRAIAEAKPGPVRQGSVGAGTGMTSFDFAGGIGTSSRVLPREDGGFVVGVLVLSNFGNMRNLTVDGAVIGRELDRIFPQEGRRTRSYGSVVVVVGTDAPLMSSQLNRVARRAALGLGRVGSHAASTSGEIVIAFSTGNRIHREEHGDVKIRTMRYLGNLHINPIYEASIEATEEAVLNAMFCSNGMTGHVGHVSPALPHETVLELLGKTPTQEVAQT
jgi:L-aminopeptidase/D-esterase-like protein